MFDTTHARLEPERHPELHEDLDAWRSNTGAPVVIDAGPVAPRVLAGIDILCWNVAIGLGRLELVLDRLRSRDAGAVGASPDRPLVVLVQEAYREDDTVPGSAVSLHHGGKLRSARRGSIIRLAEESGLSLRYSPSMRNGTHRSDRGNAVLSTVRLGESHAFLLPYVRQRRVAVTSSIAGHPDLTFVSAHLDTHGRTRSASSRGTSRVLPARPGAGRAEQASALARRITAIGGSVILGADLNSLLGMSDPAVRALVAAGMHPARRIGTWTHTFHRPLRLLLDHVFHYSPDQRIRGIGVTRIDEVPGDRTRTVFGSDHHPLLASVELAHSSP